MEMHQYLYSKLFFSLFDITLFLNTCEMNKTLAYNETEWVFYN